MPDQQAPTPISATPRELRFAQNLQRLRESQGMSQSELARQLKNRGLPFHQQTIQRIENLERPVRLNEALVICEIFQVSLDAMLVTPDDSMAIRRFKNLIKDFDARISALYRVAGEYNISRRELIDTLSEMLEDGSLERIREHIQQVGTAQLVKDTEAIPFYLEQLQYSAATVVEDAELRSYILDQGIEDSHRQQAPLVGELSLDQQIELAQWELEKASSVAQAAQDRLLNARKVLSELESAKESGATEAQHVSQVTVRRQTLFALSKALIGGE